MVTTGVDDDGDGFVDELSSANPECGPCRYAVGPLTEFVYSFCSEAVTAILADLDCGVLGARLATIPDAETDAFVFAQGDGVRSFIGHTDEELGFRRAKRVRQALVGDDPQQSARPGRDVFADPFAQATSRHALAQGLD
ncbi:MAG: hypothetical protein AAF721_29140 [Myxococcota bacterium]